MSTKIQKKMYAYCPNPKCNFRTRNSTLEPTESDCYVMKVTTGNKGKLSCPYCRTELQGACPNCGREFHEKPKHFCPACGQNLLETKRAKTCEICGRPIYRSIMKRETVFVCSEGCLSVFIQRHVKTCDQCGLRFKLEPGKNYQFIDLQLLSDDSQKLDFCSEKCMEAYKARLRSFESK
jgi:hypothetical protein